jgi:hypothetical protein
MQKSIGQSMRPFPFPATMSVGKQVANDDEAGKPVKQSQAK